jgi:hypothetical protein
MGRLPSLAPADQGSSMTARRSFTLCPFPLHLPLPPAALCHRWTGAAERLLALHLHQRARLEAHHNLDVLPRGIHPCSAAPLAASLASSSAVISIGQGGNKFEANLQQDVHIAHKAASVELILTAEPDAGATQEGLCSRSCSRCHRTQKKHVCAEKRSVPSQSA